MGTPRDKELTILIKKYGLDELAAGKLADTLSRFDHDKRCDFYTVMERHLENSSKPSAWAMKNLKKIGESQGDASVLGEPRPVESGSYAWKQKQQQDRDRKRSRERGRSRSRNRGGDDGW